MRTSTRQNMTKEELQQGIPVVDLLPLMLEEVSFGFDGAEGLLLKNINRQFTQGTLIGVMGPPSSGKGSFLELLGGVHELEMGSIFIPPHLRVLHVSRHAHVLHGSIAENLF